MEVHEDTDARLPLHRSGMTVGMSAVIENDTLDDARNVAGRLVEEVLQGSWR